MAENDDAERRRRAGRAIEGRRGFLKLSREEAAERAELSLRQWGAIVSGSEANPHDSTLGGIARAMEWPVARVQRMFRGEDWTVDEERLDAVEDELAALRTAVSEIREMVRSLAPPPDRD